MESHKTTDPILDVRNLAISYETRHGDVPAVRDVSFEIQRGEAYSIVGESGCGKSTVAFGIVNFLGSQRQDRRRRDPVPGTGSGGPL